MTLPQWRAKYPKHTIKNIGYWDRDETQLVYKSDLMDRNDTPKPKGVVFIIKEEPYILSDSLKELLTKYYLEGGFKLPDGIEYNSTDERFKVPFYLINKDYNTVEIIAQKEKSIEKEIEFEIDKPLEEISGVTEFEEELGLLEKTNEYFGQNISIKVFDFFKENPSIFDTLKSFAKIRNTSPCLLAHESVAQTVTFKTDEELVNYIINLIIYQNFRNK